MNQNKITRALLGDDNEVSATTNSIETEDEMMVIAGAGVELEISKSTMETINQRVVIEGVAHAFATKKRHTKGGAATSIKRNDSLNSRSLASNANYFEQRVYKAYTDITGLTYEDSDDDDESALFSTLKSEDTCSSDEDESTIGSDRSESETAMKSLPSVEESTTSSQKESERQTRVAENLYKKNIEKKLRATHNEACKNLKVSILTFFFPYARIDGSNANNPREQNLFSNENMFNGKRLQR